MAARACGTQAAEVADEWFFETVVRIHRAGEVRRKFARVIGLKPQAEGSVSEAREYVEAMLGFEVWSHKTHQCISADSLHDHGSMHHHQ